LLAACFGLALHACGPKGGTDVGNGAAVRYNLRAYGQSTTAEAPPIVLADGVEVDAVWVVVGSLRLKSGRACSTDEEDGEGEPGEFRYDVPVVANLLTVGVLGERPELDAAAGRYCQLHVGLEGLDAAALPALAPAELVGKSVLIRGRRADGVPFVASTPSPIKLKLEAKASTFEVESGDNAHIVGIELSTVVTALELDAFDGEGIVIDEGEPEAVRAFERAVKRSARLFRDDDADGVLSPDEREQGDELAVDEGDEADG
jgi:hypothetical protein